MPESNRREIKLNVDLTIEMEDDTIKYIDIRPHVEKPPAETEEQAEGSISQAQYDAIGNQIREMRTFKMTDEEILDLMEQVSSVRSRTRLTPERSAKVIFAFSKKIQELRAARARQAGKRVHAEGTKV